MNATEHSEATTVCRRLPLLSIASPAASPPAEPAADKPRRDRAWQGAAGRARVSAPLRGWVRRGRLKQGRSGVGIVSRASESGSAAHVLRGSRLPALGLVSACRCAGRAQLVRAMWQGAPGRHAGLVRRWRSWDHPADVRRGARRASGTPISRGPCRAPDRGQPDRHRVP